MRLTFIRLCIVALLCSQLAHAQIPTPKDHFGFNIGDDYMLGNFTQTEAYFKKLEKASDRVKLTVIGKTEEGRDQHMLIVSSPENLKKLDRFKEISTKMARAEGISEEQARVLASEGKAVVWIDGGLHATEVVGIHQLIETLYQILSRNDAETKRILDNVVILFTHANPDGHELTSNWYMREKDPLKRKNQYLPKLYQKYVGHDNNRDFYMQNMKESRNMGYQLFVEWIPQIMYNHHQRGPAGSVLAGPPYRDPFNYVFDPLMITGIDAVGAAMYNRLNTENKPGFTRLNGSSFSTWYNGGLRTTTHFHNMIGLLTEIIGGPTPEEIPFIPERVIPNNNTPNPVFPQKKWHFKQSIDYSVSLNFAVLDYAARNSDHLLYNIYSMGLNSIRRGSTDYWTSSPKRIEEVTAAYKKDQGTAKSTATDNSYNDLYGGNMRGGSIPSKYFENVFEAKEKRDPRGYIIPADQADFPTAVKFINALVRTGIQIERSTDQFVVNGKTYPTGSYIVKTAQAFRPHIIDMFEPQDYPNDFQYPGGPPIRPYDAAGWTLAYQMGVQFDRILEGFTGPFEKIPYGQLQLPDGRIKGEGAGYVISGSINDAFVAVNDLMKGGVDVFRLPNGDFFVPKTSKSKGGIEKAAKDYGLVVSALSKKPVGKMEKVAPMRIALWDTYGGSMPSGWTRWILEQNHFPFDVVYAKEIDAGDLRKKYDVIVFVKGAIAPPSPSDTIQNAPTRGPKEEEIPAEFHPTMGYLTARKSYPALKKFMEEGGKVVTIGSSTSLVYHLGLPVRNALTELVGSGAERNLPNEKYFIPGSILEVAVDTVASSNWGMRSKTDVYFDNSPVFKLAPDAISKGVVKPLAWFPTNAPLRSGWAWGQAYLQGGVAAFEAQVGKGKFYAFGPEITFRAQSHGTYKWLLNQLY